jgi:hypothetical protein
MQIHVVGKQIDRNRVIHGDLHNSITRFDLYVVSFYRNFQILHNFEDIFANLFVRVVVHHRKTRLLLDFVGQLVFRRIWRDDLYRRVNSKDDNRRNDDGLYFAFATLARPDAPKRHLWCTPVSAFLPANGRVSSLHSSKLASAQTSV